MKHYHPEICHHHGMMQLQPALSFDPEQDYTRYRSQVREKFHELLGDMPLEGVPLEVEIEYETRHAGYREIRFTFLSEPQAHVPCHLLLPLDCDKPVPVMICLQGHSTGMHISLGRPLHEKDEGSIRGGRDFALQAIERGMAALVMEQRCFGEREDRRPWADPNFRKCHHASMTALLMGRTIIGERVWDVSRAIDTLRLFPEIDGEQVYCTGNSGGGTVTYYSACFDSRIKMAIPSCSVCSYLPSIATMTHCQCNYIPHIMKYFDMGDLACLIAPRKLLVVAGKEDTLFPLHGTKKVFDVIQAIYQKAGVPDACKLLVGAEGHRYYPDLAWRWLEGERAVKA